ncbi:MAG: hypothetical protein EA369_03690 [Bradymonadales bacterium]|nr:MAG: hypothetical protein EA369_03690 [Bradymonadales bacterium]
MEPSLLTAEGNWFFLLVVAIWVFSWWVERKRKQRLKEAREKMGREAREKVDAPPVRAERAKPQPLPPSSSGDWAPTGQGRGRRDQAESIKWDEELPSSTPSSENSNLPSSGEAEQPYSSGWEGDSSSLEEAEEQARQAPYRVLRQGGNLEVQIEDFLEQIGAIDKDVPEIGEYEIGGPEDVEVAEIESLRESELGDRRALPPSAYARTDRPYARRGPGANFFDLHFPRGVQSAIIAKEILEPKARWRRFQR